MNRRLNEYKAGAGLSPPPRRGRRRAALKAYRTAILFADESGACQRLRLVWIFRSIQLAEELTETIASRRREWTVGK